jgi:hypothetical protein
MAAGKVDAVVVGADRIAANGDTGEPQLSCSCLVRSMCLQKTRRAAALASPHASACLLQHLSPCLEKRRSHLDSKRSCVFTCPQPLSSPHFFACCAANKIGTYCHAVAAHHHDIPFFVAAPTTTLDPDLDNGTFIPIEERSPEEVSRHLGRLRRRPGRTGREVQAAPHPPQM